MAGAPKAADMRTRRNRVYRLDKITLRELVGAYFAYPAIQV